MKTLITIILILSFSLSLHAQKGKWKKTQQVNTIEAYESFIRDYPSSKFIQIASDSIIEKKFRMVRHENTIEAYESFIRVYPSSKFIQIASDSIIEKKFRMVRHENTIDSYQDFILRNPKCKYVNTANDSINKFRYLNTIKVGTIEEYKSYLKHPLDIKHYSEIKELLIQKEYKKAIENNTVDNYIYFLSTYPSSKFQNAIKEQLRFIEFEQVLDGAILKIENRMTNEPLDLRKVGVGYQLGVKFKGTPPPKGYTYLITSITFKTNHSIELDYKSDVRLMLDETSLTSYRPDDSKLIINDRAKNNFEVKDFSQNNAWWDGGTIKIIKDQVQQVNILHVVPIDKISILKLKISNKDVQMPLPNK